MPDDSAAHRAPLDWDATTYDRVASPMTRWGTDVLGRLDAAGRRDRARRGLRDRPRHRAARRAPAGRPDRRARRLAGDGRGRARPAGAVRRPGDATWSPTSERPCRSRIQPRRDPLDRDLPLGARPRRPVPTSRRRRCGRAAGWLPSAAARATSPRSAPRSPTPATPGRGPGRSRRPRRRRGAWRRRASSTSRRGSPTSPRRSNPARRSATTCARWSCPSTSCGSRPPTATRSWTPSRARLADPVIDYVRLNILATRG